MGKTVDSLTEEVLALPAEERAILADRLAESLAPLIVDELRLQWIAEAVKRRDDARSGRAKTFPVKTVMAHVRKQIKE